MMDQGFADLLGPEPGLAQGPQIRDGDTVAVVGGGPAGASFAIFFLGLARRLNRSVELVVFEQKDFGVGGPKGCNQCAGVISEALLATLAIEGISMKEPIVQRGINRYRLITRAGDVLLSNDDEQRAIATVYRSGGPGQSDSDAARSFDRHMLLLAQESGANVVKEPVRTIERRDGGFRVASKSQKVEADLLIGAFGHRKSTADLFEGLGFGYVRPKRAPTLQTELRVSPEDMKAHFDGTICVTLPPLRGIRFVGFTPKAEGVTLSILGPQLDNKAADRVLALPEIARLFPQGAIRERFLCQCLPSITVGCAQQPYGDRVVLIGDACVSRLYKDGIGSAFTTANAAARAALLFGISREGFEQGYLPTVRDIDRDNRFGRILFGAAGMGAGMKIVERTLVRALRRDMESGGNTIAQVMWDMLTGSRPYTDIFRRARGLGTIKNLALGAASALLPRRG
jgi:flavin-dependent dehydrogenase